MKLYDKMLSNFFPKEFTEKIKTNNQGVPLITAREFNSVISRRLISEYKINFSCFTGEYIDLFFFAPKAFAKKLNNKEIYNYYIAANLNGVKSFSLCHTSFNIILIAAMFLSECFEEEDEPLFYNCITALEVISYSFYFHIKKKKNPVNKVDYNRCFQFFFNTFLTIVTTTNQKVSKEKLQKIHNKLFQQYEIFHFVFEYYYRISFMIFPFQEGGILSNILQEQCGNRLIDEKFSEYFTKEYEKNANDPHFLNADERVIINDSPASFSFLKFFFSEVNLHYFTKDFIENIFDKEKIAQFLRERFLLSEEERIQRMNSLFDINPLKENYFKGIREYFAAVFLKHMDSQEEKQFEEFQEQLDELEWDIEKLKEMNIKVPKAIQEEWEQFDHFLNFYLEFFGSYYKTDYDSWYIRFNHPEFLEQCFEHILLNNKFKIRPYYQEDISETFFESYNIFHKLHIKIKATENIEIKEKNTFTYNIFTTYQFFVKNVSVLLQEILPRDHLYEKDEKIFKWFKQKYSSIISKLLKDEKELQNWYVYNAFGKIFAKNVIKKLMPKFSKQEIVSIKNGLYSLEFWIFQDFLEYIDIQKARKYTCKYESLGILYEIRKCLLGYLLLVYYLQGKGTFKDVQRTVFEIAESIFRPNILKNIVLIDQFHQTIWNFIKQYEIPFNYLLKDSENIKILEFLEYTLENPDPKTDFSDWYKIMFTRIGLFNARLIISF